MSMGLETFSIGVALTAYVVILTAFLARFRKRKTERKYELVKNHAKVQSSILESIETGVVKNIYDIHNIYLAIFEETSIGQWEHDEITLFLRKAIVQLSSNTNQSDQRRNSYIDLLKQLIAQSNKLSDEATQTIPFSRTPNPERGLLTDISELAAKENDLVKNKLKELAHAITVRQETISQLSEEKGKSLKWAKWGVFGTVFFSAVSIALSIFK